MITQECIGRCPQCGSEDIDYGAIVPEGEMIYYPATCMDCKVEFKEWYNVNYNETTME